MNDWHKQRVKVWSDAYRREEMSTADVASPDQQCMAEAKAGNALKAFDEAFKGSMVANPDDFIQHGPDGMQYKVGPWVNRLAARKDRYDRYSIGLLVGLALAFLISLL